MIAFISHLIFYVSTSQLGMNFIMFRAQLPRVTNLQLGLLQQQLHGEVSRQPALLYSVSPQINQWQCSALIILLNQLTSYAHFLQHKHWRVTKYTSVIKQRRLYYEDLPIEKVDIDGLASFHKLLLNPSFAEKGSGVLNGAISYSFNLLGNFIKPQQCIDCI